MAAAVALGAIGSHALASALTPDRLAIWHTAVEYHFYNALGLLGTGLLCERHPSSRLAMTAGMFVLAGIGMFSGSLYVYAISGIKWLTMLAPLGGTSMIVGWILLCIAVTRIRA